MNESAVFISDAHLKAKHDAAERERIKRTERFLKRLREKKKIRKLILLGDFFDFWYEYDYYVPKDFFGALFEMRKLIEDGVSIDYLAGNHDFDLGVFFSEQIGMSVYQDGMDLILDGNKYYVHHGDGFAADDKGYRFLKKIMRAKISGKIFKKIHPDWGMKLALYCSKVSRERDETEEYSHFPYIQWAENFLNLHKEYEGVIIGHTHQGYMRELKNGRFINSGSWLDNQTVLVYENGEFANKKINFHGGWE